MRLSKEARRTAKALFRATLRDGRVDGQAAQRVVRALARAKPRHHAAILKDLHRRLRIELAKSHAVVTSATPLDDSQKAEVTAELRARHGNDITPVFEVEPGLLGGLRVRVGSDVWDGTVRGRLDRLAHSL